MVGASWSSCSDQGVLSHSLAWRWRPSTITASPSFENARIPRSLSANAQLAPIPSSCLASTSMVRMTAASVGRLLQLAAPTSAQDSSRSASPARATLSNSSSQLKHRPRCCGFSDLGPNPARWRLRRRSGTEGRRPRPAASPQTPVARRRWTGKAARTAAPAYRGGLRSTPCRPCILRSECRETVARIAHRGRGSEGRPRTKRPLPRLACIAPLNL